MSKHKKKSTRFKKSSNLKVRVRDPGDFKKNAMKTGSTFVTKDIGSPGGMKIILGKLPGKSTTTVQAYRLDPVDWMESNGTLLPKTPRGVKELESLEKLGYGIRAKKGGDYEVYKIPKASDKLKDYDLINIKDISDPELKKLVKEQLEPAFKKKGDRDLEALLISKQKKQAILISIDDFRKIQSASNRLSKNPKEILLVKDFTFQVFNIPSSGIPSPYIDDPIGTNPRNIRSEAGGKSLTWVDDIDFCQTNTCKNQMEVYQGFGGMGTIRIEPFHYLGSTVKDIPPEGYSHEKEFKDTADRIITDLKRLPDVSSFTGEDARRRILGMQKAVSVMKEGILKKSARNIIKKTEEEITREKKHVKLRSLRLY